MYMELLDAFFFGPDGIKFILIMCDIDRRLKVFDIIRGPKESFLMW